MRQQMFRRKVAPAIADFGLLIRDNIVSEQLPLLSVVPSGTGKNTRYIFRYENRILKCNEYIMKISELFRKVLLIGVL
jgi:hypothetical protein